MIITELWIPGLPITKGSLTAVGADENGKPILRDTPQSKRWRRIMAGAIRDDLARRWLAGSESLEALAPYRGPVAVRADWFLPRATIAHRAGDLDKLLRNLLDALSAPTDKTTDTSLCAGAIVDDNQVAIIDSNKYGPDLTPGVVVCVEAISDGWARAAEDNANRRRTALTA